jgi:predicted MFS family arabinose efflux permease
MMIFIGVTAPMVAGPTFALLSEVDPLGATGIDIGVMNMSLALATLTGPPMIGLFRDLTHNYSSSFILLSIISIVCAALVLLSARLRTTARGKRAKCLKLEKS